MEGPVKRAQNKAPVPLGLDGWIPQRDVRKLIWRHLNVHDRELVLCAHNSARTPRITCGFATYCAERGHVALLEFASTHLGDVLLYGYDKRGPAEVAARAGHIPVLEWLRSRNYNIRLPTTCAGAARGGQLRVLQWLRQEQPRPCFWDPRVCRKAAKHGHVDVLQWAVENGAPWDPESCARLAAPNTRAWIVESAHGGVRQARE